MVNYLYVYYGSMIEAIDKLPVSAAVISSKSNNITGINRYNMIEYVDDNGLVAIRTFNNKYVYVINNDMNRMLLSYIIRKALPILPVIEHNIFNSTYELYKFIKTYNSRIVLVTRKLKPPEIYNSAKLFRAICNRYSVHTYEVYSTESLKNYLLSKSAENIKKE